MTVAEFEEALTASLSEHAGYAVKNGHFTARNVTIARHGILDRKAAASIIHEFLLEVLG